MKLFKIVLIALAIIVGETSLAQVPNKPANMTPIVDMAGIIKNDSLVKALNSRLDTLSRRTTNQIVVVTVNDLGGLEANQFATKLGKKWGIGDKKSNNGLLILVKPKNDKGSGDVYIAPGQGLEGALPDVMCSHIIDSVMLPHFMKGDYASGIEAAINHIEPIVIKEHKQEQAEASKNKKPKSGGNGWWIFGGIAAAIGGFALLRKRNKKNMSQQPANDDQATETSTETAAVAATGAAAALAKDSQPEPKEEDKEPEPEPEEEDNKDDKKTDEPEPYKYKYGGGDFGGAGAGKKW